MNSVSNRLVQLMKKFPVILNHLICVTNFKIGNTVIWIRSVLSMCVKMGRATKLIWKPQHTPNLVCLPSQNQTPAAELSAWGAREAESWDRWPAAGRFAWAPWKSEYKWSAGQFHSHCTCGFITLLLWIFRNNIIIYTHYFCPLTYCYFMLRSLYVSNALALVPVMLWHKILMEDKGVFPAE